LNLTLYLKIVLKTNGLLHFASKRLNIMNFFDGSTALKAGLMAAFFFS
jgi:plasmid rolling circle replication initiator protein Rep